MKNSHIFALMFLFVTGLSTFGCQEDGCEPPADLASNIVGVWNTEGSTVEFKADGTIIDNDKVVVGENSVNGIDLTYYSYVILSETMIEFTYANEDGTAAIIDEVQVTKNDCDEIQLVFIGPVNFTLTR